MKVNEEYVVKEIRNVLALMYKSEESIASENKRKYLSRAIGKMECLVSILPVTEDD